MRFEFLTTTPMKITLPECDDVQSRINLPTFRRNVLPQYSTMNVGKSLPDYMKSHPRSLLSPTDGSVHLLTLLITKIR